MMTLNREARDRLDAYLAEMRASLTGSTLADVVEIEQDIRDHVRAELSDRPSPVSVDALDHVLQRLGSPRQWAAETVSPPSDRGSSAVIDDRLALASAGSMVLFLVFPPLLILSWLLARWTLARIEERGEALGSRQWLLCPPIAIVLAPLAVVGLLWVLAPFAEVGGSLYRTPTLLTSPIGDVVGAVAIGLGGLGAYWMVLGMALGYGERLVRFFFYPFAEGFRRRHGWWLTAVGTALAAAALASFVFLGG